MHKITRKRYPEKAPTQRRKPARRWAKNIAELARALGCYRSAIHDWRRETGSPTPSANGRHDIAKWRAWAQERDKRGQLSEAKERAVIRRIMLQCEKLQTGLDIIRANYTRNEEVQLLIRELLAEAVFVFGQLPKVLAPRVVGATVPEAARIMRAAVDEAFESLHRGH